ncbi:XRE family transcriptional regulator [Corallincola holothuriorum]|uniref:XRE family transcriptional regulator n=2 Tax=Corallincola holothuriorum TaxID=2282215 RepID=A0A368NIM7_9GAMM|nr:XRE family transcriptional regulator [Corallincola holothuriorum]
MNDAHTLTITQVFGIKLKTLRKSRGLSQQELAKLANLDRSYIGGVERGDRNISLVNISNLAKALNINIDELFKDIYG